VLPIYSHEILGSPTFVLITTVTVGDATQGKYLGCGRLKLEVSWGIIAYRGLVSREQDHPFSDVPSRFS
jgi:hypothetical protein